jgi:hypothetical protein
VQVTLLVSKCEAKSIPGVAEEMKVCGLLICTPLFAQGIVDSCKDHNRKEEKVCEKEREYFKTVLYGLIKIHLLSFECQNVITACWCKTKRLRLPHLTFERKTTKLSSQTDKAETKRMGTIAVPRFRIKQAKRECNWSLFFSSIENKLRTQE